MLAGYGWLEQGCSHTEFEVAFSNVAFDEKLALVVGWFEPKRGADSESRRRAVVLGSRSTVKMKEIGLKNGSSIALTVPFPLRCDSFDCTFFIAHMNVATYLPKIVDYLICADLIGAM